MTARTHSPAHRWFARRPVDTTDRGRVWLRTMWRRRAYINLGTTPRVPAVLDVHRAGTGRRTMTPDTDHRGEPVATLRSHLPSRHTVAVVLAAVAAVAVAGTSFARSFTAIAELAVAYKVPTGQAWMIPVAVDGLVVVATVAAAVARHHIARGYSWALLVAGTIASVAGNGIHAWELTASPIGVGIAVIPPLVTLAAVHLTILLARQDDTATVATSAGTGPTVAPDDHDRPVRDTDRDATPSPVTRLRVARATPDAATPRTPIRAATPPVAAESDAARSATHVTLALDIATATADEIRAEAIRRVVDEKNSVRATGAALNVSKDKVQRWVSQYRATLDAETVAV